ncbi:hypothetical protein H6F43_04625, partial [Leptolyngbya sp. FACHB-36]
QGNAHAIAALMNRSLQPKGITARVMAQDGAVRVMLESISVPDQQMFAAFTHRGMVNLGLSNLRSLHVYGRLAGTTVPAWMQVYAFGSARAEVSSATESVPAPSSQALDYQASDRPVPVPAEDENSAISNRLNAALGSETLTFEASRDNTILKVITKTNQILEADTFAKSIRETLTELNLAGITTIEVYKQKTKGNSCYKIKELVLTEPTPVVEPLNHSTRSQTLNQTVNKPKRKGINQIRRNLTIGFFVVASVFVIWYTLSKLSRLFFSPFGLITLALALPLLLKMYQGLFTLLNKILQDDV